MEFLVMASDTYCSKILHLQSMRAKSNWMSGGDTYQGVISPHRFEKSAPNREIEECTENRAREKWRSLTGYGFRGQWRRWAQSGTQQPCAAQKGVGGAASASGRATSPILSSEWLLMLTLGPLPFSGKINGLLFFSEFFEKILYREFLKLHILEFLVSEIIILMHGFHNLKSSNSKLNV